MALVGIFVLAFGLIVLATVFRGFVLSYLWQWFAVPLGLIEIGIVHAIGISLLVTFLTYQIDTAKDKDTNTASKIVVAIAYPLIALLIGYIVHLFM